MVARGLDQQRGSYYAADGEEPDYHIEDLDQPLGIFSDNAVHGDSTEEFKADVEVEDGTDADGAEEANEDRLLLFLYLPDVPVQSKHNR